jgi:hypothetical protein
MDEKKKCSEAGYLFGSSQGKRERFRTSSSSVEGKLVREERATYITYIQHNISNACGWTVVVVIVFGSGLRKYSGDNWVGV